MIYAPYRCHGCGHELHLPFAVGEPSRLECPQCGWRYRLVIAAVAEPPASQPQARRD